MVPVVDAHRCDGCGICALRCPPRIMGTVKGVAVFITDLCEECGICAEVCPIDAIRFKLPHRTYRSDHEAYKALPR